MKEEAQKNGNICSSLISLEDEQMQATTAEPKKQNHQTSKQDVAV